jgi:hypothetical protein
MLYILHAAAVSSLIDRVKRARYTASIALARKRDV